MNESDTIRDAAFWLAFEEYFMRTPPGGYGGRFFLLWRTPPCVVVGRNQITEAEVDVDEANRNGVLIIRRSSGGGAVYQDWGAIQYTIIQPYALTRAVSDPQLYAPSDADPQLYAPSDADPQLYAPSDAGPQLCAPADWAAGAGVDFMRIAREQVAGALVRALGNFGLSAVAEGRNDVTLNGAKISGISQYSRGGWLNTHGTLLYDTDLEMLARLLTPERKKFESKAVKSVRSRVMNIKPYIMQNLKPETAAGENAGSAEWFMRALDGAIRDDAEKRGSPFITYEPGSTGIGEINKIRANKYLNPAETFGTSPRYTYRAARRFPSGNVEFYAEIKNGIVSDCAVKGDFIGASPVEKLERAIRGVRFGTAGFSAALDGVVVSDCLGGITKNDFLELIFD